MKITVPDLSLVVLVGASGSGKSTFAARHFKQTEIISSDFCRGLVTDDENDQSATKEAFEVLHFIASKRLEAGRLTVIDATNVQPESRRPLVELARRHHCLPVAIVLDVSQTLCEERNRGREDRTFGPRVIRQQIQQMRRSLARLEREGFRHVHVLRSPDDVEAIDRTRLWCDRRELTGPFDVIGDVHGCADELEELLALLGYEDGRHPDGRTAVFLGDLVDRGPRILDTLRIVMDMCEQGALCVPGNHDVKLVRKLRGRDVRITHGLDLTLKELDAVAPSEVARILEFLDSLTSHYVLDGGNLVVAHAGMRAEMQGRGSGRVREFALYGETTGETDDFGLPVRYDWASEYRGHAAVAYGHTPVPDPEWVNKTINIDTGCVFGGRLTALRYPEKELVSVAARSTYCEPARPLLVETSARTAQQRVDDMLDLADVTGKRIVSTRLAGNVTVREDQAAAALEVMSRFAIDPRWLIYLPPTMSPSRTTTIAGLLEHPRESFDYFRQEGVPVVVCEEKHMGSRAVIVACRTPDAAARRFGVEDGSSGACYTRTGRRFFADDAYERGVLDAVVTAATSAGLWDELSTEWLCLDAEIMPWSVKAADLLRDQYASVGAAATVAVREALGVVPDALRDRFERRAAHVAAYVEAYGRYCWPVERLEDLRVAPFHLLASEGAAHVGRDHSWHMQTLSRLCGEVLFATPYRVVNVTEPAEVDAAMAWWEELTAAGGEGMVVKPLQFAVRGGRGLVQPALKCRGREYLRIIYGPSYTDHLDELRQRGVGLKRSLAVREFALGVEGLERFARTEPLRRVHECVFAVLALESEPVDPRL